ncbi:MAG: ion transporter [Alphaproteobacteria bacterium]|nr:ion transporter [Alphaproteobacteria bacterium]
MVVGSWRQSIEARLNAPATTRVITALILINAVTLGIETSPSVMATAGGLLKMIDTAILAVFVVEIAARLLVEGKRFWRSGWNWFDFTVIAIALVPASGSLSVLRAFRVLRLLRLISLIPSMRWVVGGFLAAVPPMSTVLLLIVLIFYVFAVLSTKLFGMNQERFETLGASLFTLLQIMTMDGWSDVLRPVMDSHPYALAVFLPFIIITSFAVLNLFIGILTNALHSQAVAEGSDADPRLDRVLEELTALRQEVAALRAATAATGPTPDPTLPAR